MIKQLKVALILFVCLGSTSWQTMAQRSNVWVFGDSAGVDFNGAAPRAIKTKISGQSGLAEASASICDEQGKLLFYTDGSRLWDRLGNIMSNGSNLTGIVPYLSLINVTFSTSQGTTIIPFRYNKNKYFVFSLVAVEEIPNNNYGKLFYSVVDMSLNNGYGDVVPGARGILLDSLNTEQMVAVEGDRCNAWVLVTGRTPRHTIKAFEIVDDEVRPQPVVSEGFPDYLEAVDRAGNLAVSPDRKRIALTKFRPFGKNGLALFDFDPATGKAGRPLQIGAAYGGWGVCFAPNSKVLYAELCSYIGNTLKFSLFQFDLSNAHDSSRIVASQFAVDLPKSQLSGFLKLGPDRKMYRPGNNTFRINSLSRINYPDRLGAACAWEENIFPLYEGTWVSYGLPAEVPIPSPMDTSYARHTVDGPCFANARATMLSAPRDTMAWGFRWSNGSGDTTISVSRPGVYWLRYRTPPCAIHLDTFVVHFAKGVLPALIVDTACYQQADGKVWPVTYPGDTVRYAYTWLNVSGQILGRKDTIDGLPAGRYMVRIQTWACDTNITFDIPERHPQAAFKADSLLCAGALLACNNISDPYFHSFSWTSGDGTSTTERNFSHRYFGEGSYTLTLRAAGNKCVDSIAKQVLVDPRFLNTFVTHADSLCVGETIDFTVSDPGYTTTGVTWDFGDGHRSSFNQLLPLQHAYESAGLYSLQLRSQFRTCPDTSFQQSLYVEALPLVDLGPDRALCFPGGSITLSNTISVPANKYRYYWNTGDTTAQLTIRRPGTYQLAIRTKELGCTGASEVTVSKRCYVDIPNVFTPNGDGHNDYFFPRPLLASGIISWRMQIFNSWGQMVFDSHLPEGRGWDGTYNRQQQPEGAYVYKIVLQTANQQSEVYRGNVTLLR